LCEDDVLPSVPPFVRLLVCMCECVCVCMYVCMYVSTYIRMYVLCIYVCMYVCMYVRVYVYICMYVGVCYVCDLTLASKTFVGNMYYNPNILRGPSEFPPVFSVLLHRFRRNSKHKLPYDVMKQF
jgi:hypothetical protein